ncbi:MAG: hypothetical protein ACLQME_11495 [Alphaproteobacteria bacterium]
MVELYLVAVAYLVLHLALYLALLRHLAGFRREATIFAYHAISSCLYSAAVLLPGVLAGSYRLLVAGLGLVMLHGLYSITFLELWSLSQISYSIAILAEVRRRGSATPDTLVDEFARTGEAKKTERLRSLSALGLLCLDDGRYRLTGRGELVGGAIRMLRWLANYADTG